MESSDFADDFEAALLRARWQPSRMEWKSMKLYDPRKPISYNGPELPKEAKQAIERLTRIDPTLNTPRRDLVAEKAEGIMIGLNARTPMPPAEALHSALAKIGEIQVPYWFSPDLPTGVTFLIVAPKPTIGFRSVVPRMFQPSTAFSNNLARFSWTNTVVVHDPADEFDAARLSAQIAAALKGVVPFTTNSTPWLAQKRLPFFEGVEVEARLTPVEPPSNLSDEKWRTLMQRGEQVREQADALVSELNKAGVTARRSFATRPTPFGWINVKVGKNPTRERIRQVQESDFLMTNRFNFFPK
jgi:hypothetical protein